MSTWRQGGVNDELSFFLHEYMLNKHRIELIQWFGKVKSFVEKQRVVFHGALYETGLFIFLKNSGDCYSVCSSMKMKFYSRIPDQ